MRYEFTNVRWCAWHARTGENQECFHQSKMAEEEERPFKAEYAKSSRAACKQCKGNITKDTLRMAKMVQVGVSYLIW